MFKYIADSNASALTAENDHITNLTGPLIYTPLLEICGIRLKSNLIFHWIECL